MDVEADDVELPVQLRRACDPCRSRKIRCDRETPCSNCQHAGIDCRHASSARPREKRTRVLITPQYEKKIDHIDHRLEGVVQLLGELKAQLSTNSQLETTSSSPANPLTPAVSTPINPSSGPSTGALVEGEASITAQSVFANEFVDKAVSNGTLKNYNLEMSETLAALRNIVEAQNHQPVSHEMTYPNARQNQPGSQNGRMEMPPIQKAVSALRFAKENSQTGLTWVYEFLPMQGFSDLCLKVYFSPDYTDLEFIIINAGLKFVFEDYVRCAPEAAEREEYARLGNLCRENLETSLSRLPLHLPATRQTVLALLLGAFHVVELARPSLAWTLASTASQICQTLGYHRKPSTTENTNDPRHYNAILFWGIYVVDKGLSLKLGRTSTIRDCDITVSLPPGSGSSQFTFFDYYRLWIKISRVQGNTYEQLYSHDAISQPASVRQERAQALAQELQDIIAEGREGCAKHAATATEDNIMSFVVMSDEVFCLALLTLIYRAVPGPSESTSTFSLDCISAARATLERHQDCITAMGEGDVTFFAIHLNWTILSSPFVPFIVIFCHVIETASAADLDRLQSFITFMQAASSFTDAAGRHYRLFQVLYNVARRYVEVRTATSLEKEQHAGHQFDTYLTALGFPAAGIPGASGDQGILLGDGAAGGLGSAALADGEGGWLNENAQGGMSSSMMWMGYGSQLGDWFQSNQQMMGMLEDENTQFL